MGGVGAVSYSERRGALYGSHSLWGYKDVVPSRQSKLTPLANYCITGQCSDHRCATAISFLFYGDI